jgi:hypothetical protein
LAGLEVERFAFVDNAIVCDGDAAAHNGAKGVMCCLRMPSLLDALISS